VGLDGAAPLAFNVHAVENLGLHLARLERAGQLENTVRERGLAVIDVGDDREITDELLVHDGTPNIMTGATGAPGRQIASPRAASTPPDGAILYTRWCAACHGFTGRGNGPNAANLPVKPAAHSSKEAMSARPDDSLYDVIAAGGAVMNRSPRMPGFGATLSAAEIRSLVRHIRSLCACEGPAWSRNP
jgi:mono/diheme cytochrome c family protein